jgi:putative YhdH/YhfP family quinone oxidoreductase
MDETTVFRALRAHERPDGAFERKLEERRLSDLPAGELLVRVMYSSLNYKDALSATGHRGVTKRYPHTPGIDAVGTVVSCATDTFPADRTVIVTGHDLGANTPGGWGEFVRVPSDWAVGLPDGLSARESMALGTAGLTAAMAVFEIVTNGIDPDRGDVLVTGATGGVGCLAIGILSGLGYRVVGASGKGDAEEWLKRLGAAEVIGRTETAGPERTETAGPAAGAEKGPLARGRWAAVVDSVGGAVLADAIRATGPRGVVTCCGNAGSEELKTTVYPFILRGVRLIGIDSAACPREMRKDLWRRLAGPWMPKMLDAMTREVRREDLDREIVRMREGSGRGRVVVKMGR